jgi:hypothetical protein
MQSNIKAALDYAAMCWPVFPCSPTTKRPLVERGFYAATTDPEQITAWWTAWPNAMIGIPTGPRLGLWVLDADVDPERGKDGEASLARLLEETGTELPPTLTAYTPRGGKHLWFKWDAEHPVGCSEGELGPDLDTRGEGGYAIVPPSVRADGRAYSWQTPDSFVIYECPAALLARMPLPGKLKAKLNGFALPSAGTVQASEAYGRAALLGEADAVARAPVGRRNGTLFKAGCRLFRLSNDGLFSPRAVADALHSAASAAGLDASEIRQTLVSAWTATRGQTACRRASR